MRVGGRQLGAAFVAVALVVGLAAGYGLSVLVRPQGTASAADTVLLNARIYVMDDRSVTTNVGSVVQAMAIKDGKVMAVGTNEEIAKLVGPSTQKLDVKGRAVIPGLIDTHSHLMDYAIEHWATEANRIEVGTEKGETWQSVKKRALEILGGAVRKAKPGDWISMALGSNANGNDGKPLDVKVALRDQLITREELDRIAPENPVHIQGSTRAILNSKAIALVSPLTDEPGVIDPKTGFSQNTANRIVKSDFLTSFKALVAAYAKENEEWAAYGITTWSSSLRSIRALAAYQSLDRDGKTVIRFAYGPSLGTNLEQIPENVAGLSGYGSSYVWYNAMSSSGPDGSYPELSTTIVPPDVSQSVKAREKYEDEMYPLIEAAIARGVRWANTHIAGDRALDGLLDAIERGSQKAGLTLDQIRAKRHATDHCAVNPRPDQIARLARLGMFASCSPKYIENSPLVAQDYGEKYAKWVVPVKSLLDGKVRTALELDSHDIQRQGFFYFLGLLVNREVGGKVWSPDERIDRVLAMKMATVWASEYLLHEKEIGSLEPGKWADFVVLDKDYFDRQQLPDNVIRDVRPLLTAVGGKVAFLHLRMAGELGTSPVGIQPKF